MIGLLLATAVSVQCAPHEKVVEGLARNYSETVIAMGIGQDGRMIEMFTAASGTWTIIATSPDGLSCLVSAGGAFEIVQPAPAGVPG